MIPFSHQVIEALRGRKTVTADELLPLFPGKKRGEVTKALQNAEGRGFVKLNRDVPRSRGDNGVYLPSIWHVVEREETSSPPIPCVSCVWELGSGPVEIPFMQGRKFFPLGGWS
jgi:hypothetical protein